MFTRILVPTDFSAASDAALEYGKGLAERFGASLHLLHVLEDPLVTGAFATEVYVPSTPGTHAALLNEAEEELAARMPPAVRLQFHGTTDVVCGTSARTITEYARDHDFDLIVMGTHGRSGIAHVLMGSVAGRVVRLAPCPVLTVRAAPEAIAVAVTIESPVEVPA